MKLAILSDIHGNLEGLTAVLDDVAKQRVDAVYCLGDIVGYGPNPCECVDRVIDFQAAVLGNHDQGALYDPEGFSSGAERAIFWTRDQLENSGTVEERLRRIEFLNGLPRVLRLNEAMFVHGSARNPLNEYVFPEDIYNARKLERIFSLIDRYCFQGHTHVPGIFVDDGKFLRPDEIGGKYVLASQKVMINVGSVGQPRDGNPLSCYVIFEPPVVSFHRVDYPREKTVAKIHNTPDLDDFLGNRLLEGK